MLKHLRRLLESRFSWEQRNRDVNIFEVSLLDIRMDYSQFDVFLCHNSKEKPQVEQIREQLRVRQIYAFLDKYDFEPFRPWQNQLEEIMPRIKSAAIFLGASGVGSWEDMEMRGFLQEFVERRLRLGLVILPGCPDELIQEVPRWLRNFHYVDFRQTTPNPMNQLIWGITGQRVAEDSDLTEYPQRAKNQDSCNLEGLKKLLSEQKWQQADELTKELILKSNDSKPLMALQIRQLPLELLDCIDHLWMDASSGRFGLRIQRQLWQGIKEPKKTIFQRFSPRKVEPLTDSQVWSQFGSSVGWYNEEKRQYIPDAKLEFSLKAAPGCFPRTRLWLHTAYGNAPKQFITLLERVGQLEKNLD